MRNALFCLQDFCCSFGIVVEATRWTSQESGFDSLQGGGGYFSCPQYSDIFWGTPSLMSHGYGGLFIRGVKQPGREADLSPPRSTTLCCDAYIKHREKQCLWPCHASICWLSGCHHVGSGSTPNLSMWFLWRTDC